MHAGATQPPLAPAAPEAAPVEIAFLSFTEITDPAGHGAYNEWHQLDHLPEQFTLPGVRWGQRWVRTPACRAASRASGSTLDPIHYLTCYLMTPPLGEVLSQFRELGADLRRRNRFYDKRRALLSGPFRVIGAWAAPSALVAPASVPFRPNRGVHVALWDGPPGTGSGPGEAATVRDLLGLDGVAGVWELAADPEWAEFGWGADAQVVRLTYLDESPISVAPAIDAVSSSRGERPDFSGPLETIAPWVWDWFDES
jgi:hypothetical protein